MTRLLASASLFSLLAAPALAQDSPDALAEAFVVATEAEDSAAIAALFTDDAVSYSPGSFAVTGAAAIGADWQVFFDMFEVSDLTLEKAGGTETGDTASAWGTWSMTVTPEGADESMVLTGRYMDVSTKTDGGWRYMADHASVSPVIEAAEAEEPEAEEPEAEAEAVVEPASAPVEEPADIATEAPEADAAEAPEAVADEAPAEEPAPAEAAEAAPAEEPAAVEPAVEDGDADDGEDD